MTTEMQQALKMLGHMRLHVLHNPAGTYSFVGAVPVDLGYVGRDGHELTADEQRKVAQFGAGMFRSTITCRTFTTAQEAVDFAASRGETAIL